MQNARQRNYALPKGDTDPIAVRPPLFNRARTSRGEIAIAVALTLCAVGFTVAAVMSTNP